MAFDVEAENERRAKMSSQQFTDESRPRHAVYASVAATGNYEHTFAYEQREILFSNDADKEDPPLQLDATATVRITGPKSLDQTFVVYYGEVLDERLAPFTGITITANYKWRYITRSGVMP
jgi:hypothetical protein